MRVTKTIKLSKGNLFSKEQAPLIQVQKKINFLYLMFHFNPFLKTLGLKMMAFALNDIKYNLNNINHLIMRSTPLKRE